MVPGKNLSRELAELSERFGRGEVVLGGLVVERSREGQPHLGVRLDRRHVVAGAREPQALRALAGCDIEDGAGWRGEMTARRYSNGGAPAGFGLGHLVWNDYRSPVGVHD
jgi:hypothetical protein